MDLQISFIHYLQTNFEPLAPVFQSIAFLGTGVFYLIIIPFILWNYNRSLGSKLLVLISINGAIFDALKMLFHLPRPYWVSSEVKVYSYYNSFGFPSGHAQNVTVFFGFIASWVKKVWIQLLCVLIILLVGLARIFQASHFPTDVLGGYCFGLILLFLFLAFQSPVWNFVRAKTVPVQIGLAFTFSIALILFSYFSFFLAGTWHIPQEWIDMALTQSGVAIHPEIPHDTLMSSGLFFGGTLGLILTSHLIIPEGRGPVIHYILRFLIGMVILFVLWTSLEGFASELTPLGLTMVYIQSMIAGVWITAGAPLLFKKIGILKENSVNIH
jgi:membrane-associated phospholipid phosphatase